MTDKLPRSVRNNNPGNIRIGQPWQGLMPREQMNDDQRAETAFAVFVSPVYGFRAMCKLLKNYGYFYGAHTLDAILNRYAPPGDHNNTQAYKVRVAQLSGFQIGAVIDFDNPAEASAVMKAMSTVEAGGWFFHDDAPLEGARMAAR